jgi:hypothetical protein
VVAEPAQPAGDLKRSRSFLEWYGQLVLTSESQSWNYFLFRNKTSFAQKNQENYNFEGSFNN